MSAQWIERLSSSTAGLRVAICQPIGSSKLFLDLRKTFISGMEDKERLSDEGLRVRIKDLNAVVAILSNILRGVEMAGAANDLSFIRRSKFLVVRRMGRGGDFLKLTPAQVAFVRVALTDLEPQVKTLQEGKEEEDEEGSEAVWDAVKID